MKLTIPDRIFLLMTGLLAAYQVAIGINGLGELPIIAYTISFGILLVASLLLLILGLDSLESPLVVVISTIIPLSLSLGLVWQHLSAWRLPYLIISILGFLAILFTRLRPINGKLPTITLAVTHGLAGMVIFLLPSILAAGGVTRPGFALVGLGGALIGLAGLLLSFLKTGKPILPRETLLHILPALLFLTTLMFVAGFQMA